MKGFIRCLQMLVTNISKLQDVFLSLPALDVDSSRSISAGAALKANIWGEKEKLFMSNNIKVVYVTVCRGLQGMQNTKSFRKGFCPIREITLLLGWFWL